YVNALSNVANWTNALPTVTSITAVNMSGGVVGASPTDNQLITAIDQFNNRDQIKINTFINGGYATPAVQLELDSVATTRQDTVCILDVPSNQQDAQNAINYRNLTLNLNSNRSALFTSDLQYIDFMTGEKIYLAPSGAVAARVAYTDYVANPGYSIAGMNRGVIPDAIGVRVPYTNQGQWNALASAQVNYFRSFVGQGIVLWEQRTLQTKLSALSFLSVRRIFDIIENSIRDALKFTLQEPNDPFTVKQIVNLITQFLNNLVRTQAISVGTVVSNSNNNPPQLTGQGILNVDIYITPNLPVNQINLRAILTQQGVSFVENAGGVGA
ncbi:MAG TPA: phage tail sheath C-terminal domain-containing protein, partial [Allocoleopsis sp.]